MQVFAARTKDFIDMCLSSLVIQEFLRYFYTYSILFADSLSFEEDSQWYIPNHQIYDNLQYCFHIKENLENRSSNINPLDIFKNI